jgi:L-alanine-DL-glutamate epimerase-like enolase superfamily enzyme
MGPGVRISSVEVMAARLPLRLGQWQDQVHTVSHIDLVVVDVGSDDGSVGTGISHTSGVGVKGILGLLSELAPELPGRPAQPGLIWDWSWRFLHDCGGGGITTLSLAAVDMALWDLAGKALHAPVVDLLGRRRDYVPLYASGINLNLSQEELVEQVKRWHSLGYKAAKIKVGKDCLEEDVERVAAVRRAVPDLPLMVDANQGWTLPEAVRRIRSLQRFDLVWVEEPLLVDDVAAHEHLAAAVGCPIALGENVYTVAQFKEFITRRTIEYVQADVARVGGITPYMRVAELAAAHQLPMAPHFIMEISAEVVGAIRNLYLVEDTTGGTLRELGAVEAEGGPEDGMYQVGAGEGLGIEWDRAFLNKRLIDGSRASYG